MDVSFLFMDERKSDAQARKGLKVTKLTGILVPSDLHRRFRTEYYSALNRALPSGRSVVPTFPVVHAMELFKDIPGATDAARLGFVNDVVSLVLDMELPVLNSGYLTTSVRVLGPEARVLGLCFMNFLWALGPALDNHTIWPVMEYDGSSGQDQAFAGSLQNVDHVVARVPHSAGSISINYQNLGEVLYTSKRTSFGATVDILSYILHKQWLRQQGEQLTVFAGALADVAERLRPALAVDEIIEMSIAP